MDKHVKYVNSKFINPPFWSKTNRSLEKRIESGDMTVADEKRALLEITKINRTRRIVENFQADQDAIDSTRQEIDELRKQIDDPEAKALSDRFEAIKRELNEIKKESDEVYAVVANFLRNAIASMPKLKVFFRRNVISNKLIG